MSGLAGAKRKMGEDIEVRNEEVAIITVDTDLLYCFYCFEPLRPPLFQCGNGHVACALCRDKLHNKCPTCSSIIHSRCIALEKLVESIKVECKNDGCNKMISYADKEKHEEETCTRAPYFCPIQDCSFSGAFDLLLAHVDNCHKDVVKHLKSSMRGTATVSIEHNNPLYVIRLDNYKEVLFLLANDVVSSGNALSMTCICPETSEYSLEYELTLYFGNGVRLNMKSPMKTGVKKWTGSEDSFLLAPRKLDAVGSITVYITIRKKKVPAAKEITK